MKRSGRLADRSAIFFAILMMACAFFIENEEIRLICSGLAVIFGCISFGLLLRFERKYDSLHDDLKIVVEKFEMLQAKCNELEKQEAVPSFRIDTAEMREYAAKLKELERYFIESSSSQEEYIRAYFKEIGTWRQNHENLVLFKKEKVQSLLYRLDKSTFPLQEDDKAKNVEALVNLAVTAVDMANGAEDDINVNKDELYNLMAMKGAVIPALQEVQQFPDKYPAWMRAAQQSFRTIVPSTSILIFNGKRI